MNMPLYCQISDQRCLLFLQWLVDSNDCLFETRDIHLIKVVDELWRRNVVYVYFFYSLYVLHLVLLMIFMLD